MILGNDGPPIVKLADAGFPSIDHWLNRESHARHQRQTRSRPAVVQDLRFLVKILAYAMPAELTYHAVTMALGVELNGVADVSQVRTRFDCFYSPPHALISNVAQSFCLD